MQCKTVYQELFNCSIQTFNSSNNVPQCNSWLMHSIKLPFKYRHFSLIHTQSTPWISHVIQHIWTLNMHLNFYMFSQVVLSSVLSDSIDVFFLSCAFKLFGCLLFLKQHKHLSDGTGFLLLLFLMYQRWVSPNFLPVSWIKKCFVIVPTVYCFPLPPKF